MASAKQFWDQAATLKSCYSKPAYLHCQKCSICSRETQDEAMTSDNSASCPTYRKTWKDEEGFITDNLREIYSKLPKLENEIWGKLIVMEENCRILKAYLRNTSVQIDGSDSAFDGKKLGLKKFSTNAKLIKAIYQQLKNGLQISIDKEGNLWAERTCQCPVFAQSFGCSDQEVLRIEKRPTKIFDIQSLKTNLICSLGKMPAVDAADLELVKKCFICLQIGCHEKTPLQAPSWLIIVHLVALEFLNVFTAKEKSRRLSTAVNRVISNDRCRMEPTANGRRAKMYSKLITSNNARNKVRTKSQDSGFHSNGDKSK